MHELYPSSIVSDETVMLLRGVGEPVWTQTRIKRCKQHHPVSQYYMHALFLVNIKAINTLYKYKGNNYTLYNRSRFYFLLHSTEESWPWCLW